MAQASRILGHSRVTTTLDVYTHLFDQARHSAEICARMAQSAFARLLGPVESASDRQKLVGAGGRSRYLTKT